MSKHETDFIKQAKSNELLTPTQISCMTKFTRTGEMDMRNAKPFRNKQLKVLANEKANREADGAWRSCIATLVH